MATATKTKRARRARGERRAGETDEQRWEREQRERAEKGRDEADKNRVRRARMSADELREDDARIAAQGDAERRKFEAMTQDERNKFLDETEPLPPWQTRLSSGRIFDAREQRPIQLLATDGRVLTGGDAEEAREFYLEYVGGETAADEDKD
jgi:cobalamin-dependent methionine synthase I